MRPRAPTATASLSVQLVPGTTPDRVGIAQFIMLDLKRIISAAAIDAEALAAEQNERNPLPKGSAPKAITRDIT